MFPEFCQRDRPYCFTCSPNHEEHHQSLMLRAGFYIMKIRHLSRPGFEPRTFGLAYTRVLTTRRLRLSAGDLWPAADRQEGRHLRRGGDVWPARRHGAQEIQNESRPGKRPQPDLQRAAVCLQKGGSLPEPAGGVVITCVVTTRGVCAVRTYARASRSIYRRKLILIFFSFLIFLG